MRKGVKKYDEKKTTARKDPAVCAGYGRNILSWQPASERVPGIFIRGVQIRKEVHFFYK